MRVIQTIAFASTGHGLSGKTLSTEAYRMAGTVDGMDLSAEKFLGGPSSRWAKVAALFCFALATGLLIGTLVSSKPAKAIEAKAVALHLSPTMIGDPSR